MADPEHLAILRQGVEVWNQWRMQNKSTSPDLSNADLEEMQMPGIDFHQTSLHRARLRSVNLSDGNLDWANLLQVDLSRSTLRGVTLRDAYLMEADLHRADLTNADLRNAHLSEVNFSLSTLAGANFANALVSRLLLCEVDLSQTRGLEQVHHARASSVDLNTLYNRSRIFQERSSEARDSQTGSSRIGIRWLEKPLNSILVSSATQPRTRSSQTACTPISRIAASAVGSRPMT